MSQGEGEAFSVALQLCAKVRRRGPGLGWEKGWAAVLPGPGPTVLDLGLSPCKAAITTPKGQPRDVPRVSGRRSVYSGRKRDKKISNEQRSQDSKVWGRGEVRVVTHVNLSGYSFDITMLGLREQYPCSSVCLSPHGQSILFCRAHSIGG